MRVETGANELRKSAFYSTSNLITKEPNAREFEFSPILTSYGDAAVVLAQRASNGHLNLLLPSDVHDHVH